MQTEQAKSELVRHLSKRPFRPFRVVLGSGERFDVTRQFQLGYGLARFGYARPEQGPFVDRRLDEIVKVVALEDANASQG